MSGTAGHDDDVDNDDGAVETTRSDARQASRQVVREGESMHQLMIGVTEGHSA